MTDTNNSTITTRMGSTNGSPNTSPIRDWSSPSRAKPKHKALKRFFGRDAFPCATTVVAILKNRYLQVSNRKSYLRCFLWHNFRCGGCVCGTSGHERAGCPFRRVQRELDDTWAEWYEIRDVVVKLDVWFIRYHDVVNRLDTIDYEDYSLIRLMHDIELNPGPVFSKDFSAWDQNEDAVFFMKALFVQSKKFSVEQLFSYDELVRLYDLSRDSTSEKFTYYNTILGLLDLSLPQGGALGTLGSLPHNMSLDAATMKGIVDSVTMISGAVDKFPRAIEIKHSVSPGGSLGGLFECLAAGTGLALAGLCGFWAICLQRRVDKNPGLKIIIGILATIAASFSIFAGLSVFFKQWNTTTGQAGEEDVAIDIGIVKSVDSWVSLALEAITIGVAGHKINFQNLGKFTESLVTVDREVKGLGGFVTRIKEFLKNLIFEIARACGLELETALGAYQEQIDSINNRLAKIQRDYTSRDENGMPTHKINFDVAREVNTLELEIRSLERSVPLKPELAPVRSVLDRIIRQLAPIQALVSEAGLDHGGRAEPFFGTFVGAPAVGKSKLMEYLIPAALSSVMTPAEYDDYMKNPARQVYSWAVGSKTFDAYNNQLVVYLPDLFSATDIAGQESEATFIVNAVGVNPYPLAQADLPRKGKVFLQSKIILACTNQWGLRADLLKSVNNPQAVKRRLADCCWCVVVREKYRADVPKPHDAVLPPGYDDTNGKMFWQGVDLEKANAGADDRYGLNLDIWEFIEWDFKKQCPSSSGRVLNFDQFVSHFQERFISKMRTQDNHRKGKHNWMADIPKRYPTVAGALVEIPSLCEDVTGEIPSPKEPSPKKPFVPTRKKPAWKRTRPQASESKDMRCDDTVYESDIDSTTTTSEIPTFEYRMSEPPTAEEIYHENCKYIIPNTEGLTHCPSQLEKLEILMTKLNRSIRNEGDGVKILESWDEKFEGLQEFVHQYIKDCESAEYVIGIDNYHMCFLDDIEHPINRMLDSIPYTDLKKFAKLTWSDGVFASVIHAASEINDFFGDVIASCRAHMNVIQQYLCDLRANPWKWLQDHPLVVMAVGSVAAAGVMGIAITVINCLVGGFSEEVDAPSVVPITGDSLAVPINEPQSSSLNKGEQDFISKRVSSSCYHLSIKWDTNKGPFQRDVSKITFLGGRSGITTWHSYKMITDFVRLGCKNVRWGLVNFTRPHKSVTMSIPWQECKYDERHKNKDLVIITFPKNFIHEHPNVLKYLPNRTKELTDLLNGVKTEVRLVRAMPTLMLDGGYVKMGNTSTYHVGGSMTDPTRPGEGFKIDVPLVSMEISEFVEIDIRTQEGECGELAFLTDERRRRLITKDGNAQHPMPFYMHTSVSGANARGILITKEMFAHLTPGDLTFPDERIAKSIENTLLVLNPTAGQSGETMYPAILDDFEPHHRPIMELAGLQQHCISDIKKSPLYGIFPRTRKPAKLRGFLNDEGEYIDPMKKARAPYGSNVDIADVSYRAINHISNFVATRIMESSSNPVERDVLDIEVAIRGDLGGGVPPLNPKTSAGFTLNYVKQKLGLKGKGKTWLFGEEGINMNHPRAKEFVRLTKDILEKMKLGDRSPNVYTDCLKDELRDPDKYARMFCSGDTSYLVLCKMYYGRFASWIYKNRIKNGICIGINPFSTEWDQLYNDLRAMGDNGIFGDFSKFDKRMFPALIYACLDLIRKYYGEDDPEANRIRELLFEDMVNSYHAAVINGTTTIYEWLHGNTSGNYLTAIINSVANIVIMVYAMCTILLGTKNLVTVRISDLPLRHIWANMVIKVYGDDNALSISSKMPEVTFHSLRDAIPILGMAYTDELKGKAGDVPPYRPIDEGNFIARGFRLSSVEGMSRMLAPLRWKSILESFQWYRGKADPETLQQSVENSLREITNYGEKDWNNVAPILIQAWNEKFPSHPLENTIYDVARENLLSQGSPYWEPLGNIVAIDPKVALPEVVGVDDPDFVSLSTKNLNIAEGIASPRNNSCALEVADASFVEGVIINDSVKPQSSEVDRIDHGRVTGGANTIPAEICDNAQTTCFVETEEKVESSFQTPIMPTEIEMRNDSIADFLGKPKLLTSFQWNTSSFYNANLASGDVKTYLNSITEWKNKIIGYALVRGTFNLRVEVNASPFQAGRMLLHYIPCLNEWKTYEPSVDVNLNRYLNQKVQHPCVEIDARKTVGTMQIPFVSPYEWYAVKEDTGSWGTWYLDVFTPLTTGATGQTYAEVQIYGYWTDFELAAPTVPQSGSKDKPAKKKPRTRKDLEIVEFNSDKPISSGLNIVESVADSLSGIPILSEVANGVSWVARMGASLASAFGWSKPRYQLGTHVVGRQLLRNLQNSNGTDVSVPLGVLSDNKLELTTKYSITDEDEMSMAFLLSVPFLMPGITWSTTQVSGTSLFGSVLNPAGLYITNTFSAGGHTLSANYGAPFSYLGQFFKMWRGGFQVTLKFVKTQFHSGRLQVTWTPGTATATAPTLLTSLYSLRHIIDIREQDEITLELPYLVNRTWLNTDPAIFDSYSSGRLDIIVLNDLRCPETTGQSIDIIMYIKPGKDFEYAVPGTCLSSIPIPVKPQSAESDKLMTRGVGDANVPDMTMRASLATTGEKITSLKQFFNRATQLCTTAGTIFPASAKAWYMYPWGAGVFGMNTTTGAFTSGDFFGDALSAFMPMYVFFRGSSHIQATSDNTNHMYIANPAGYFENNGGTSWTAYGNPVVASEVNIKQTSANGLYWPLVGGVPNDVDGHVYAGIPYYGMTPVAYTMSSGGTLLDSAANRLGLPLVPKSVCQVSTPAAVLNSHSIVHRNMGEDFQLSFFIGSPPWFKSYV